MRIKVLKLKNGKKLPQRAYKNDTGADVFTTDIEIIPAGKVKRVPLGIAVEIPKGFNAYIANKSGLSTKGL
jgi:dUTP pyrophosphatase